MTKPGQYSVTCAACADLSATGNHDAPLIVHFLDADYRNQWARGHTRRTGHQVTLIEPETP